MKFKQISGVLMLKETAKAMLVQYNELEFGEVKLWLPKHHAALSSEGVLNISEIMYAEKMQELREALQQKKNIRVFGKWQEFDRTNSYSLHVYIYEAVREKVKRRYIYIPKKVVIVKDKKSLTLPEWLWRKRIVECLESCKSDTYHIANMIVQVETELVE